MVGAAAHTGARALVLGTEHPRSAAAVRSLAAAGVRVEVADHYDPPTTLWRASNAIKARHLLDEDYDTALAELLRLGVEFGGMLVPSNDHYLILVSRHHAELSEVFTVAAPPWNVLEPVLDKVTACDLARRAGLEAPERFRPRDRDELETVLSGLDTTERAYVVKIRMWDDGAADAQTLRRVAPAGEDVEAIRARCEDIFARTGGYPLIEQVMPGGADRCIGVSMAVGRDHKPVLAYCVRRLKLQLYAKGRFKHPYELGANAYCESVHDPEAIEQATRFVAEAKFVGAITVELKRDAVDGRLKFIKADPRFVRATGLSTVLGLDLPRAVHEVFSGANRPAARPADYAAGVNWIWLEAYAYSLWKNRRDISLTRELWSLLKRLPKVRAWAYFT